MSSLRFRIPLVPRRAVSPVQSAAVAGRSRDKLKEKGKKDGTPVPAAADPDENLVQDAHTAGLAAIEKIVSSGGSILCWNFELNVRMNMYASQVQMRSAAPSREMCERVCVSPSPCAHECVCRERETDRQTDMVPISREIW